MLRLTVAHAKCRLSQIATEDDARAALEIMSYALYHEVSGVSKTSEVKSDDENDEDDDELEIDLSDDEDSVPSTNNINNQQTPVVDNVPVQSVGKKRRRLSDDDDNVPRAKRARMNSGPGVDVSNSIQSDNSPSVSEERVEEFGRLLVRFMTSRHLTECNIDELCNKVNSLNPSKKFEQQEALSCTKLLEQKGKLLFRDNTVYLIS